MTSVDMVVLGVVLLSGLLAFFRGLVREVLGLGALVGAAAVAIVGLPTLRPILAPHIPVPELTDPAAYVILFLGSLIVFWLIAKLIANQVQTSKIRSVKHMDRAMGGAFGLARGAALVIVAYIVGSWIVPPAQWPEPVRESISVAYAYKGADWSWREILQKYNIAPIQEPPPPRQTTADGLSKTAPTGRASDPPIRR
jgi:membrane protein required for colicin V production